MMVKTMLGAASLGERILALYRKRKITINFKVEGKDVDSFIYVPICSLSLVDELHVSSMPGKSIKESVGKQHEYEELSKDTSEKGKTVLKQVNAFVTEATSSSDRWLRDCTFAAGLLEPTYSILGYKGLSKIGEETLAEHLQSLHDYLLAFDTNVFISNLFSNYLRLRNSDMSKTSTATMPAVVWELERKANDKTKPRESRLAKNAFRDVASMQAATKHMKCLPKETEAEPSDRLIRRQIRNLLDENGKPVIYPRIFVSFDRINALAAHAEGILCCSVDVPEQPLKLVGSEKLNETVGSLLLELAIFGGIMKITCDRMTDYYVTGDWAGKTSREWLSGLVRLDNFPIL
jgi:hypothetical protein